MPQKPHRLSQGPTRQGVGAETAVVHRKTHLKSWVLQVGVKLRQHLGSHHSLVNNGPAAQGGDINVLGHLSTQSGPHTGTDTAPQPQQLAIKACVVGITIQHPLLDHGGCGTSQRPENRRVDRHRSPPQRLQAKGFGLFITQAPNLSTTAGIGRHEHHAEAPCCSRLGPDGFQIRPGNFTQHPRAVSGVAISPATATVLHASQTTQGLLQHPVTGLPLELSQETNATRILLARNNLGCRAVAVRPDSGTDGVRHRELNRTIAWACSFELCRIHLEGRS